MRRRVVVTGMGMICPLGTSTHETWQNSLAGNTFVSTIPEEWHHYSDMKSNIWAPLPEIDFEMNGVPRVDLLRNDKVALLAFLAAKEALQDAGYQVSPTEIDKNIFHISDLEQSRTGIYMGTAVGGVSTLIHNHSHHLLAKAKNEIKQLDKTSSVNNKVMDRLRQTPIPNRFNPFVIPMLMPNAVSAYMGIKLGITGPNTTTALACASGTAAIGQAYEAVATGVVDSALCGGSEYLHDDGSSFRGFDVAGTLVRSSLEPEYANRPFDVNRNGFLFSEGGAAVLVLEDYESAIARKANVYAELIGYAETFDAHSMMQPAEDSIQCKKMINRLSEQANVSIAEIDYINTHGTGTKLNDQIEANLIENMFPHGPWVTATKSLMGHSIGASGAIEAAITALSIHNQTTHTCRNLETPIADLNFVRKKGMHQMEIGLTQSFAFGGHNTALLMKRS